MVAEDGEHGQGRRRARLGETASTVGEDGEHGQGVGRDEEKEGLEMRRGADRAAADVSHGLMNWRYRRCPR